MSDYWSNFLLPLTSFRVEGLFSQPSSSPEGCSTLQDTHRSRSQNPRLTLNLVVALTIPNDEYEMCMEMARSGYAALGLTNDLLSWEKERHDAMEAGLDYVFNAIWVIMKERSASEAEAKKICCSEIKKHVSIFKQTVEETRHNSCLSQDLRTYLEAVLYSISGNLVWSIYCPRYREF